MENAFLLPTEQYKRDLNFLQAYVNDQAKHLEIMTGKPYETCLNFVKEQLRPGGKFPFKDPAVQYTERQENGDREVKVGTLLTYLNTSIDEGDLIVPTLTTYLNPKKKKSLLVDFIDQNVKRRSIAKHAMFQAKLDKDPVKESFFKNEQNNRKIANNSISGAHLSASQPLYNKTAHSTLTSNCRSTSGFGNANNEKMLSGNRHYWSAEVVIANIISIINHTDYALVQKAIDQYGLVYPSVQQTLDCIQYSTDLYWKNGKLWAQITRLVERLTPIQRASFVYTGDLYHLMRYNDAVMRDLIGSMAKHPDEPHPDAKAIIKAADSAMLETAVQICEREMRGKDLKKIEGTREYGLVAAACDQIQKTVDRYFTFIRAFLVSDNVPASLASLPESIRRSALTSDTDSTIFTVQDWVGWYFGVIKVDPEANAVTAVMVYFASKTIVHILAKMSANFGIGHDRLFQIAMKNEFKFDVFVPTQVAKHYFAMMGCQEGNLFEKYAKEIKGVHLKSSNAPREIIKRAETMMIEIMETVMKGEKISILKYFQEVAGIERNIKESLERGDSRFFRKGQIKLPESYTKSAEESPYAQYMMWEEVFAPDYGSAPLPPYVSVKIATSVDTAGKNREWLSSLENQALAKRMEDWMARNNKKYLGAVQLPEQLIASRGIPKEILEIAGIRKIIRDTTSVFYLIFEALGFFILDKKMSRLLMDLH